MCSPSFRSSDSVPGRVALVASRDIQPGEMLSYDYDTFNLAQEKLGIHMNKIVPCCCHQPDCRLWVF